MDIQRVYQELTGIDIQQQKVLWDERGKGYYGEYLVFEELYRFLPGACKILMNLEIPVTGNKTTEIDLLLICETGLYVFEVKHYKGTIYGSGNGNVWTQYFRTAKNNCFKNPVLQNSYHIKNLQKLFPELPVFSFIVFTNDECDLRIDEIPNDITVCKLNNLQYVLQDRFVGKPQISGMFDIDKIFQQLSVYSKMSEAVIFDGEEKAFSEWLVPFVVALNEEKENIIKEKNIHQADFEKRKEKLKKNKILGIILNILIAVICVVLSMFVVSDIEKGYLDALQNNTEELELFKQNFLHVDQIDNPFIDELQSYINVDSVTIKPLTDDAISFVATLSTLTDTYLIRLQENARYIVITTDGKVFEYDVFDSSLKFNVFTSTLGKGFNVTANLQEKQFYGITIPDDIEYIKMINVSVLKNDMQRTVLKSDLQFEIYQKQSNQ